MPKCQLHGVRRAIRSGLHYGRPKPAELLLEDFQAVCKVSTTCQAALQIYKDGEIAAHSEGVHVVEEDEAVAAEQVLNVVLRRHDEEVQLRVFQKAIEARRIERSRTGIRLHLFGVHWHGDAFLSR